MGGPRPERPELAEFYQQEMPEFRLRLQTKAGLTGRAQVFGKYNTTPYDKLLMDLQYIANANIAEDLRIMFATIKILFLPESTEGVAVGQITAMDEKKRPSGSSITKDNFTKDSIEHRLSDAVYHYDSKDRVFERADTFENRMQEKSAERGSILGKLQDKKEQIERTAPEIGQNKQRQAGLAI